jgi:hypothetical protein
LDNSNFLKIDLPPSSPTPYILAAMTGNDRLPHDESLMTSKKHDTGGQL